MVENMVNDYSEMVIRTRLLIHNITFSDHYYYLQIKEIFNSFNELSDNEQSLFWIEYACFKPFEAFSRPNVSFGVNQWASHYLMEEHGIKKHDDFAYIYSPIEGVVGISMHKRIQVLKLDKCKEVIELFKFITLILSMTWNSL